MRRVSITVNGAEHALELDPRELLVYVLREEFRHERRPVVYAALGSELNEVRGHARLERLPRPPDFRAHELCFEAAKVLTKGWFVGHRACMVRQPIVEQPLARQ